MNTHAWDASSGTWLAQPHFVAADTEIASTLRPMQIDLVEELATDRVRLCDEMPAIGGTYVRRSWLTESSSATSTRCYSEVPHVVEEMERASWPGGPPCQRFSDYKRSSATATPHALTGASFFVDFPALCRRDNADDRPTGGFAPVPADATFTVLDAGSADLRRGFSLATQAGLKPHTSPLRSHRSGPAISYGRRPGATRSSSQRFRAGALALGCTAQDGRRPGRKDVVDALAGSGTFLRLRHDAMHHRSGINNRLDACSDCFVWRSRSQRQAVFPMVLEVLRLRYARRSGRRDARWA